MTLCCMLGSGTCMRRAPPMAGWGTSPSPPISLEVSTITTRLWSSSDSTRAISRITVVLPTPGLPRKRTELGTAVGRWGGEEGGGRGWRAALSARSRGGPEEAPAFLLGGGGKTRPPRPPRQQPRRTVQDVPDHVDVARHGAAHAAGQPDHGALAVADGGDAVQRPLHARAVVAPKRAQLRLGVRQVLLRDLALAQELAAAAAQEARLGAAPQVEHHLQQVGALRVAHQRLADVGGQHLGRGVVGR